MRGLGSDPSMGARRLARARVGVVTSAGRVRGSGAAVQLWGGLEGADLGEAVQRSGRPAFVAMMEPADFVQLDDPTHRRRLDVSMVGNVFVQGEVGS